MQFNISICGLGSVGSYFLRFKDCIPDLNLRPHSLGMANPPQTRQILYIDHDQQSQTYSFEITSIDDCCQTIFLTCDISRVDNYLSYIAKYSRNKVTYVYLFQNGLLDSTYQHFAPRLIVRRISLGGISLAMNGYTLVQRNKARPSFEISIRDKLEMLHHNFMAFSLLDAVGDVRVVSSQNHVIWNKLVRTGPHFIDTLLASRKSTIFSLEDRLILSKLLFEEYCTLASFQCQDELEDMAKSYNIVRELISNNVPNSGAKDI